MSTSEKPKKTMEQIMVSYLMPLLTGLSLAMVFGIFNLFQEVQANTEFRNRGDRFTMVDGKGLTEKVDKNTQNIATLGGKMDVLIEGVIRNAEAIKETNKLNRAILNHLNKGTSPPSPLPSED
jgi:hypothetical protein